MGEEATDRIQAHILWWGRSTLSYSRNEIVRRSLKRLGCRLSDFRPLISRIGAAEARLHTIIRPDLLWIPCFRHRDMPAAVSWAKRKKVPVIFDPLISSYDKQVYERKKFSPTSIRAKRLFTREKKIFHSADLVICDTEEHASYFHNFFSVQREKLVVIPVGANESLFTPAPPQKKARPPFTILFFGSFLGLHNPLAIIEAARLCDDLSLKWLFVGDGPLLDACRQLAATRPNIEFLPWVPYKQLPGIIHSADILLGIFGTSAKARRVIPNKVYQALACGKPLITIASPAFPAHFTGNRELGIEWVEAGNSRQLADAVTRLTNHPEKLIAMGANAHNTYRKYFSEKNIRRRLARAIEPLL